MTEYLLAAEADKIQDFIFRASALKEVFGGSNFLSRFCQVVPQLLKPKQIIVADGGSFRLSFADRQAATGAGERLAALYYQATGCGLSVAEPVPWDGTPATFGEANPAASRNLRLAKRSRGISAAPHIPHMALCASTGVELATTWSDEEGYRSAATVMKRQERVDNRDEFIGQFLTYVEAGLPGERTRLDHFEDAGMAGQAGGYDPRNYVAYLVADGNNMGARFDAIRDPDILRMLSTALTNVSRDSLAQPTTTMMRHHPSYAPSQRSVASVLPLILGGDDIFALLPAPCAISFAAEFCRTFEAQMVETLQCLRERLTERLQTEGCTSEQIQQQVEEQLSLNPRPTMSAGVVICKANYPFRLAHERGEALLKEAKRVAKQCDMPWSTVNYTVIIGSDWGGEQAESQYQITRRPYFVPPQENLQSIYAFPAEPPELTVQTLLDQRYRLRMLPQKRRTLWRAFFDTENLPKNETTPARREWADAVSAFVERTAGLRNSQAKLDRTLTTALETLGTSKGKHFWREQEGIYQNAVPDVLDAWSFLYDLNRDNRIYMEAEA